ncbi:uncharacterized protein [Physcomitrium patens]|uniref:Plastid ribosomal protein S21 n=1 Tax=Physcomitrium patens TaxID=3218 RepID=A9RNE5_PHYPA|nr:30S ribosomal protein S21, chloroplastic-like [Physcomitrium patens]PNR27915.1 hypothetical protein PHYPA_028507 [Physcomitrium patens]|eukprot:XP_024364473.1 30S ribosomal protein S21, chloroplastic-like [Physcomitrella patens]
MALSSAVIVSLRISPSVCCSAAEPNNHAAISSDCSVKLAQPQPVSRVQHLSLLNRENSSCSAPIMSMLHPGMEFVNVMYFKGSYNAQIFVGEDESADSVVRRFRRAVSAAGVIPECRRRRFHETPQDIVKRKQKEAHRRNKSNRRFSGPRPEGGYGEKKETSSAEEEDDDFWGYVDEDA